MTRFDDLLFKEYNAVVEKGQQSAKNMTVTEDYLYLNYAGSSRILSGVTGKIRWRL
jgi:hypothetical protein